MSMDKGKIVVTGATGNVGRPLVEALVAAGTEVVAVSRGGPGQSVSRDRGPSEVDWRVADLAAPESLRPVLDGAGALFLMVAGDLGDRFDPRAVLDVAKAGGVGRVVLLSSQGAGTRPTAVGHAQLRAVEDAVRDSGMAWTVLRPGGFHSNAFMWVESIRTARVAAAPFAGVGLPFVDPADIASVAAAALRDGTHEAQTYVLTGPAPVTPRDRVQAIGEALGEPVRFVPQTREEARAVLLRFMPEPVADGTLAILGEPTDEERSVSPDVARVLGRPPASFADWAARNVAAFR